MTHAESITRHIDRQKRGLRVLRDALGATSMRPAQRSEWDAREILLHLLGATTRTLDDLRRGAGGAGDATGTRQRGGEYLERPDLPEAADAADALLCVLDELGAALRDLDDDALERPVEIMSGDEAHTTAPIGLVVRHSLTEHFDEHVAQLREVLGPTG